MDISEHYRELGLETGTTHVELVRTYRRRILRLISESDRTSGEMSLNQQRQSAADSFLALEKVISASQRGFKPSTNKAQATLYLESEVFRFQQTPLRRLSLVFSPAKSPTSPTQSTTNPSLSRPEDTIKAPLTSSLAIGSIVGLTLIALLGLVLSDRVASLPLASAAASVVKAEPDKPVIVETAKPSPIAVAPTGGLVVRTNRPGARVEVRPYASSQTVSPNQTDPSVHKFINLAPGDYRLVVSLGSWAPIEQVVTVTAKQDLETLIEFNGSSLRLDSDPSGAVVLAGDNILGKTPLLLTDLPPGKLTLSLQYEWWPASKVTRTISESGELSENFRFPRGRLTIASSPAGAAVMIEGKDLGKTPLTIDQVPAGQRILRLNADDFETTEISLTIADGADLKIHPSLTSSLKQLNPNEALNAAWSDSRVSGRKDEIAPNFERDHVTKPKNGIVRNLNRQTLDANWLRHKFRYKGTVKSYDSKSGLLEFEETSAEKSKYRVSVLLSIESRSIKDFTSRLLRGSVIEISGRLTAVEEPRWPSRTILFEISEARPVR